MKTKVLSFILCVTLLLGVFPFVSTVTAVDGSRTTDTVIGKVLDNAAYVSSTGNDSTAEVNNKANTFATVHAAMNALIEVNGGYVVITDAVTVKKGIGQGDCLDVVNAHECVIVITSLYGGVDYRTTNNAVMQYSGTAATGSADSKDNTRAWFVANGPTVIENINIKFLDTVTAFFIAAKMNPFVMGNGINFYKKDSTLISESNTFNVYLAGNGLVKYNDDLTSKGTYRSNVGTESHLYIYSGYYSLILAGSSEIRDAVLTRNFVYFYGGTANRIFGGTYNTASTTKGAGSCVLYLKGGKVTGTNGDVLIGCQKSNASDSMMNSNCYVILDGTTIKTGINSNAAAVHATSTGLYDVLIYDSSKYSSLSSLSLFEHIIDKAANIYADEVYVKQGGSGKKDGSSAENAAPDLTTAYLLLGEDGGTIKLCDDYTLTPITNGEMFECTGNGTSTTGRYFIEPYHTGKVTITSADETKTLSTGGRLVWALSGDTTLDNVSIDTSESLYFVCRFNDFELTNNCTLSFADEEKPWIVAGSSFTHVGKSGFQANHSIGGRFKSWTEDVTVTVSSAVGEEKTFAAIYGFTGYNVAGQKFTGKYTLNLENTIASTVVLGVRGATGTGSAGSAVLNMRGTTRINALYPAGDNPNGPTTGDVTVNYYGGTVVNNAFGDANLVLGTTTFNDLSAEGNAALCEKAFRDGFDVVTGYKTVTLINPASLDLADVTDVMLDGLTVKSRGSAKALRALHESGDNFTILVPEDTTASTVQMVTDDGNYAYTVCPVESVMTANRAAAFDNAFANVGFSIRSVETGELKQGLRFKTSITKAAAEAATGAAAEFGLLAKKTTNTDSLVLANVDTGANGDVAKSIAANNEVHYVTEVADTWVYATAVSGIPEEKAAYETSFSFRPYVTAEIGGKTYTFYGDEDKSSIYDVAVAATGEDVTAFVTSVITTVEGAN